MPKLLSLSAVPIIIVVASLPAVAQPGTSCSSVIPKELDQYLAKNFQTFRPKLISDLASDDRRLWSETHGKACPGFAAGHFERADELSYALLLIPQSHSKDGYRLVVVTAGRDSRFQSDILDSNDTADNSGMVIARVPPGKQSAFEGNKTVRLQLDSISVQWLEKAAVLYYWSSGKFRTLDTSD